MKLSFSDRMRFDTSGEYRVIRRSDGYYVIGKGCLIPVSDLQEGREMIKWILADTEETNV